MEKTEVREHERTLPDKRTDVRRHERTVNRSETFSTGRKLKSSTKDDQEDLSKREQRKLEREQKKEEKEEERELRKEQKKQQKEEAKEWRKEFVRDTLGVVRDEGVVVGKEVVKAKTGTTQTQAAQTASTNVPSPSQISKPKTNTTQPETSSGEE